ncbi:hypothetical protein OAF54_03300, partial [bacterium]|nr:hypothetical protein [bacterium]
NKPQLVNSITNKSALVEIEFSSKGKEYLIRRGIKPAKFEIFCDGILVDQNASIREYQEYLEKTVLKLNHKSFTQIVVIGSANFVPFMQMKVWERRSVIEDLLDIEIFTKMHNVLKERIAANKDEIISAKYKIDLLDEKISLTRKHLNEIASMKKSDRDAKLKQITELEKKLATLRQTHEHFTHQISDMHNSISDSNKTHDKKQHLTHLKYQLEHKVKSIQDEITFFEHHDDCPTCTQPIDSHVKQNAINDKSEKQKEIEQAVTDMSSHFSEVEERLAYVGKVQHAISAANQELMNINSEIMTTSNSISEVKSGMNEKIIEEPKDDLNALNEDYIAGSKIHESLLFQKELFDRATSLLKDGGIKGKIIKQYVPIINKLMNKYLAAMEFFVQFELDEQFNEKIKSRFRDEFTYDSFSEGEKMRIDLSLLFTWRAVAKLRNSVTTNLLIMDEVFDSSLDNTGTDEFMKLITQLTTDTNVFVISHKGDQLFDKFHSNIKFEKVKNFSQIAA